jgi:hypothetical protein
MCTYLKTKTSIEFGAFSKKPLAENNALLVKVVKLPKLNHIVEVFKDILYFSNSSSSRDKTILSGTTPLGALFYLSHSRIFRIPIIKSSIYYT